MEDGSLCSDAELRQVLRGAIELLEVGQREAKAILGFLTTLATIIDVGSEPGVAPDDP